jgi:hypothetical protein
VPDPDPEQEPSAELVIQACVLGRHVGGLVAPHVDDARRDRQPAGALEERPHVCGRRAHSEPQRAEAELLQLGHTLHTLRMAAPDPDPAQPL